MKFCKIGIHKWKYIPNLHGGKPMHRICAHCQKAQMWNYDKAREYGIIEWINK